MIKKYRGPPKRDWVVVVSPPVEDTRIRFETDTV